ncbi:cytochrome-c peroxidase [Marinoscillum pacificum]|uniref:cytochrome-c peroxidase n=1 Tax=Marinoscillum pacificum TaxID=392723 RepID=UPI002157E518|nr:cytochrome c peroxidase [Marinoscillum pacificum]
MKYQALILATILFYGCTESEDQEIDTDTTVNGDVIAASFGDNIDLDNLFDYESLTIPAYINKDNTGSNNITNEGATLGRVLFYDVKLSIDNSVACASCHQQSFAFSDGLQASGGVNGSTGRHSMRLVNSRFADEENFFWDERALSLEEQTTQPIQDHTEMGFSGEEGNEDFEGLIEKLEAIEHYQELFKLVYGDSEITEERIQLALAQFIRSIQSFDSKYDVGRAQVNTNNQSFPNFTEEENMGKQLFTARPDFDLNGVRIGGGAGCDGCHRAPEFDIDPDTRNNGVIHSIAGDIDTDVTRAPSLRDIFNDTGKLNGPLMHTGDMSLEEVIAHYNEIELSNDNNNLDRRLMANGIPQQLNLTDEEIAALSAFIKTLSGTNVYTAEQWSDPFKK